MSTDTLAEAVRRDDPDRYLAALFAPEAVRARLMALYAFYGEIARIPDAVSEPVIGEMRLAWARDAVGDLFASPRKVRRHDVYEGLSAMLDAPGAPDRASLVTLIEARGADLGEGAFPDAAEREAYVDRTAGLLLRLAVRLCAPGWTPDAAGEAALTAAGRAWGYTGLLRAFAPLCAAGRPPLTVAEMVDAGLTEAQTVRAMLPERALAARKRLEADAAAALSSLRQNAGNLPAEAFPALGYVALARGYLKAVAGSDAPYAAIPETPLIVRQSQLLWASLRGRL